MKDVRFVFHNLFFEIGVNLERLSEIFSETCPFSTV